MKWLLPRVTPWRRPVPSAQMPGHAARTERESAISADARVWSFLWSSQPQFGALGALGAVPAALKNIDFWCRVRGLNSRPTVYKTAALPLS
jgi:hypothetical protein